MGMTDAQFKSPRRRRWFQVSLRTFLVMMLLVSLGLGWLGSAIQRGRERRNAVLAIVKLGGRVEYFKPSSFFQRSDWLRKSLGDELLLDVKNLEFQPEKISDADLVHLKGLTKLEALILSNTQVSDAGLVHLRGLTQLYYLHLGYTQVSDTGLVHLKGLTQLVYLDLTVTPTSVEGVGELQEALPNCTIFWFPKNATHRRV